MYYCFHPCCQFSKPRPAAEQHFGVVGTGVVLGQSPGVWHSAWQTLIQSSDLHYNTRSNWTINIRSVEGGNGTEEVRVLITSYFVLFEKLVWMRDQHVHTSCHTLLTRPSLSVGCIQETLMGGATQTIALSQASVGYSSKVFHHPLYQRLSLTVLRFTVQLLVVITSEQESGVRF